jgi:hypothetical protein
MFQWRQEAALAAQSRHKLEISEREREFEDGDPGNKTTEKHKL